MIFTFSELGIKNADYNGIRFAAARALIINQACDYIMTKVVKDTSVDEFDAIPSPDKAEVNMIMQTVTIDVNMESVMIH